MIVAVQISAILFAYCCARHDAPAVDQFEFFGVHKKQLKQFHFWNNGIKLFYCIAAAFVFDNITDMVYSGLLSALWIYLCFDIILNRVRERKQPLFYLGSNDGDGKFWQWLAGKDGGELKALVLSILIIGVNLLKIYL